MSAGYSGYEPTRHTWSSRRSPASVTASRPQPCTQEHIRALLNVNVLISREKISHFIRSKLQQTI